MRRSKQFRNADDFDSHLKVRARPGLCNLDLFPDTPAPDPAIGRAAEQNSQIASEMQGLAREQWDFGKQMTQQYAPIYERMLNSNINLAEGAADKSNQQWADYDQIFRPIEKRFASDAMNYDSPDEQARREGLAAGTVQAQYDSSQAQTGRNLASMGVSPDSGRSIQAGIDQGNTLALAKAGAINQERNNTKLQGMAMRQSAAQFGRNQTSTSIAQNAAALQGNQAATGVMGAQTATTAGAMQPATGLYSGAISGNQSAANIGLNLYGQQSQNSASEANSRGSMLGLGLGAASMFMSDENKKEDVHPADDDEALSAIRMTPVEKWKYKDGEGDGQPGVDPNAEHTGAMAQDLNATMGQGVAPGGKMIDPISYMGTLHAGLRALDAKVRKMGNEEDGEGKAKKKRDASGIGMKPLPI